MYAQVAIKPNFLLRNGAYGTFAGVFFRLYRVNPKFCVNAK